MTFFPERRCCGSRRRTGRKKADFRNLVFGLMDCCAVALAILPLFGVQNDGIVQAVSLTRLVGVAPYLRLAYWIAVAGMAGTGILTLVLRNCRHGLWRWYRDKAFWVYHGACVLLFIVSRQPYGAALLFLLLSVKVLIRLREG